MMLRKLLVVLGLMSIPFGLAQAQEVYFSISGRQAKVESGEKKGIYDIWIKPKNRVRSLLLPLRYMMQVSEDLLTFFEVDQVHKPRLPYIL